MQAPHYSVIMCIMKMAELLLLMGLLILSFDALTVYGANSIGCYWIPAGNQPIDNCPNYSTNMTCSSGETIHNITVNARYNTTCQQNDASCTEACCQMNSTDTNITLYGNVTSDIVLFCSDNQNCTAWWDVLTFSEYMFSTTNKDIYAEYDCITGTTVSISTSTSSTSTDLNVTTPSDNSTTSSATNVAASVTTESTAATSTTTESRKSSTQAVKGSDKINLPLVIGPSAAGFVLILVVILVVVVCCRRKDGDVTKEKTINQDVLERNENSEILNNVDNESLSSYDEIPNAKRESANRISADSLYARVDDPGLQASDVSTVSEDMDLQERKQNNKRSTKRDSYDHIELKGNVIKINPQLDTDNEDYSHLVNSKNRVAVDSYSHVQIQGNGTVTIGQHIGVTDAEDEEDDYSHLHGFQCDTNTTGSRNTDSIYNVTTNIDNARHDREYIGTNNTEGIYNHLMTSNGSNCEANYKPTENNLSSSNDEGIVADCTEDDTYNHVHEHDIGTPELDMQPCPGVMPLTKGSYIKNDVDDIDMGKIAPDNSPIQNEKRGVQADNDVQHSTQFAYQMATPIKDEHIIGTDSADKSSYL